ncbi:hypothetical protein Q2T71_07355 [Yersinia sp. 1652 StPb PI]
MRVIGSVRLNEFAPKARHFIDLLKGIEKKGLLEVVVRTVQK